MDHVTGRARVFTRRSALKLAAAAFCTLSLALFATGCATQETNSISSSSAAQETAKTLEGHTLNVYCGAGMTDPFQKIADAFEESTGCAMNVTFANAAQIQTQISTTEEGDFFIAGSAEELKPIEGYVASQTALVKHIPVLAVPADNPRNITGIADLASAERVLVGDPESTPIGKIAKKALTNAGIWDGLMSAGALTTTTTAPQIATALASGEGDAGIVWKENVKADGVKIVETSDLDAMVKVVPAAQLTCSADADAATAFNEFLQTDEAMKIWAEFGYEQA